MEKPQYQYQPLQNNDTIEMRPMSCSHPTDSTSRDPDSVDLERHVTDNQKALQALADRAWFKRGWIAQEIGTNTPATKIWADASIDWETLAGVCEKLNSYHHLRSRLGITTSDICFLYRRFIELDENTHHANRFNFVYELQRSRHLRFTDDKDRVFAFLGHFSVRSTHPLSCGPVPIMADYTKTVEQTYINVAVRMLRANPAAVGILLAAVQHPRRSLPSRRKAAVQAELYSVSRVVWPWPLFSGRACKYGSATNTGCHPGMPDWRYSEGIILAEPICPHRAHGDSTAKLEIVGEDDLGLRAPQG
ncbi:hypothetical protein B0T14DRAFT_600458 [Immersiella caudata]|uniref:Uncharacterized protein n=1 Tax=Immersiella caudata TaxID=314043 RepID=A0AA40C783_9PEZI|nr:hypothetical protein B0T14DRAFT_600458 [Immersiella caudata]